MAGEVDERRPTLRDRSSETRRDSGSPGAGLLAAVDAADPLRGLLASAPFGIALVDASLRWLEVNPYLARANGVAREDHSGRTVRDVLPQLADELEPHALHVLRTGEPVEHVAVHSPPQDGEGGCDWLVSMYPVWGQDDEPVAIGAVVLDVTEQVRTAGELARRTRQQAAVARFGQRALAGMPVEELADEAVRVLASTLEVEFAEVLECVADSQQLLLRAGVGWAAGMVGVTRIGAGPDTQAGYVLTSDRPVIVEELAAERRFRATEQLREHGVVSGLSVVIEAQGLPYGVLAAHSLRRRSFSTDDVAFVQSMANVLGAAVERSRTEQRLRLSAHRLHLAMRAGRLGAWEWDLRDGEVRWSETLETIYGLEPGGFGGTFEDFVARLHPDDRDWVLAHVERAARSEEPIGEFEHRIVLPGGQVRWLLATGGPLRDERGEMVGLLGLAMDITDRKAAEEERDRLLEAEHRARTEAEAARERLAFLARATAVVGSWLDQREVLRELADLAVPDFAECCAVDLLEDGVLHRVHLVHVDPGKAALLAEIRRRYPPRPGSNNPLLRVLETREPLLFQSVNEELVGTVAADPEHAELIQALGLRTGMCVPLVARGRALGVLSFARRHGAAYDGDDLAIAADLGRRVALAVDNARLFAERAEGEQRFRRLAQTLQASLLPPHLPEIAGLELAATYRPAAKGLEVGGDFYDVFPLEGAGWGVVIGDVCGKGPDAASLTAFARYTLRAAAVQQRNPSDAVGVLNTAVLRDDRVDVDRFLTLAFARLHPVREGVRLTLCLAGHPPPLILRANGTVEAAGEPGSLVGVLPEPDLADGEFGLAPGDAMLWYTDGVIEARGRDGIFGEARLAEVLAGAAGRHPEQIVDRVEDALGSFGPGLSRDDRALLCLRIAPR